MRVIETREEFAEACATIAGGLGPIAIDAERASGFTYSQRAYLIQVYRREAGTFLFDPPAIGDLSQLGREQADAEWVLHAASQDLACLREVGIHPTTVFDTELSARLLGMDRVGLGAVVEELLGVHLAKEHSAVNWSTRPLPESWLTYAALDVELLVDLRDAMEQRLEESGKLAWAHEEFAATVARPEKPAPADPWRKLSGVHTLRSQRQLAVARSLWNMRDEIARAQDVSPGRLVPDASLLAAARVSPTSKGQLAALKEFSGRASRSMLDNWWSAIERGLADDALPALRVPSDTLPPPRAWADRKPEALERLTAAKDALARIAEEISMPVENLLTPGILRELAWQPPETVDAESVGNALVHHGARTWQVELTAALIADAFVRAPELAAERAATASEEPPPGSEGPAS
jgi:ribonuclease D